MAKKKRRRKASWLTKAINAGVLLLAFARPLGQLMAGNTAYFTRTGGGTLVHEATFGLATEGSSFDVNVGLQLYGPMIGAVVLKKAISMVRKTARV